MRLRLAISGSACTGKTSLATHLSEKLGLPLIPEAMRAYLETGSPRLDRVPIDQVNSILASFRRNLKDAEHHHGFFVADNGILDLEAYAHWYGCTGDSDVSGWAGRYDAVVMLPAGVLPYRRDGIRHDDPHSEMRFQALLERISESSPLAPILLHVPRHLSTPWARAEWLLAKLQLCQPPVPRDT